MEKKYDLEDRLIQYAAKIIMYRKTMPLDDVGRYYGNQLMRSGGSSALNFGETQGTNSTKDYVHKISLVIKELKESKVNLRILETAKIGDKKENNWLLNESIELIKIMKSIRKSKKENL